MDLVRFRALFPSADKCVHLNHAGTSPIARPVAEATQAVLDELMSDDSFVAYKNHEKRKSDLRGAFGAHDERGAKHARVCQKHVARA
jgi:hypothetical protein